MATPTLILGANNWAIEEDNILGYALGSSSKQYLPREISFTRGSDATYTDSTGIIRRSPWNLCLQSENFTSTWLMFAGPAVTPNAGTAPNGTQTATILNSAGGGNDFLYQNINTTVGATYTQTLYVKNINSSNSKIWTAISATPVVEIYWSGATITSVVGVGVTSSYTSVGDGWYRVILTYVATTTTLIFRIYSDSLNTSKSIYIWGAQLVEGSDPLPYLRTTDRLNVPRVDSSTGTKAFLLEPQRTNLILQSNTFNTTWQLFGGATITSNSTTSPEGLTNATTLNSAGGVNDFLYQSFTVNNATTYTVSFFVKNVNSTQSKFYIPLTATPEAFINWSGSTLTSVTSSGTNSFTAMSNGWYRVSVTATATATGVYIFRIYSDNNNTSKSIYIYGTQLEVGAYPTTYIPTQATTVTRLPDVASKTGISGLIGQTEGTIFLDFIFKTPESNIGGQIGITDSSKNNRVVLWNNLLFNTLALQLKANGTNAINNVSLGTFVDGTRYKIAIAYKSGDTTVYVNGTQTITDSASFTFASSLSDFTLGTYDTVINACYQFCYKTELYNTRLTNTELAALTTL
jgi:hypothetical protein